MLAAAVLIVLTALIFALTGKASAPTVAHAAGDYDFRFTEYSVTYDIRTDRTMDVQLDLTVKYLGRYSTGLKYDIPVNAGDRVRNLKAYKLNE